MRISYRITRSIEQIRTDVRRRRSLHAPTRVIPAADATHRDIVLGGATVQLSDAQIEAAREVQAEAQRFDRSPEAAGSA